MAMHLLAINWALATPSPPVCPDGANPESCGDFSPPDESAIKRTAAVTYLISFLISFLPALLFFGWRRLRRGMRAVVYAEGEGGAAGDDSFQARTALRAARRSAAQRRLRVSGLMAQSGWALNVFGMAPIIKYVTGDPINAVTGPHSFWVVMVFPGLQLFYLALLPTDARAIRTSCALGFASFAGLSVPCALATGGPLTPTRGIPLVVLLASAAGLGPTLLCRGRCAMQPRQALQRFWLVARLFSLAFGVLFTGWASADIASYPDDIADKDYGLIAAGATCILCALLTTPANRGRLHRRLGRLGGHGTEEEEAAAISALVAGADPDTALANAAALFRCLRASRLAAEDLAGSGLKGPSATPSAVVATTAEALAAKTEPAKIGEVTCFLSHSWRDEEEAPGEKYQAFARWAREQEEATGKEVTLWLDKACIDQNNIDQSLACLPIFLSGCQNLLIVAGPTYCSRLWCVMEIFTFLRMGGERERIELKLIANPGQDQAAAKRELAAQLGTFNASKAQCYKQEDRQRLLAVIEAGFGDFDEFNKGVREVFKLRLKLTEGRNHVLGKNETK